MDKPITPENFSSDHACNRQKTFRAPITWDADSLSRDLYFGVILLTAMTNKKPDEDLYEALYELRVRTLDYARRKFAKK